MSTQMASEVKACMVSIETISINPYQPRRLFDPEALEELADSIKAMGIIQPPVVRQVSEGAFELVAGERRFRAAQLAGLQSIPVIIQQVSTSRSAEASLVENIHRADLNAVEIAKALRRLMVDFGLTQDGLADRVKMKRSTIANYLRLLILPLEVQNALTEGKISMGHAKALLSLESPENQCELLGKVIRNELSVRETEELAKGRKTRIVQKYKEQDIHLKYFQEALQRKLGTKVAIQGNEKRGKIIIDYFNLDDVDRLMEVLEIRDEGL